MAIDDGQGYDDLPATMVDESLLKTGIEGNGDAGVILVILAIRITNGPSKFLNPWSLHTHANNLTYIRTNPFSTQEGVCLYLPLSSCLFNLPHSLCKAASMIQWHGEGCCTNHPWAGYHWGLASIALEGTWSLQSHLPGWCERMYFIFSLHVETSSSWLSKNIKALMANLASSLLWWGIPTVLPRGIRMYLLVY